MPINVFSNSSSLYDNCNKNLYISICRKAYLRTNYIEANIEEDVDLKIKKDIKI